LIYHKKGRERERVPFFGLNNKSIFVLMISALKKWFSENKLASSTLLLFGLIYCSISLVNHYNFRTAALDLGMFNHALYSFSHGKMNHFTMDLEAFGPNYFADHFSPITILYVPFYYIFGSWTLLLIQIAAILFGAWGTYKVAQLKLQFTHKPVFILVIFLAQWAIISALSFDFHNNVIAAMFVPWLYYHYLKKEKAKVILYFVMMLMCKENIALWLVFILIGLMLENGVKQFLKQFRSYLTFEIPLLLFAAIYFYIIVGKVMPALGEGHAVNQIARFGHLGGSIGEIIKFVFTHPIDTFKMFFESTMDDPISFGIKKELHLVILFSGGIALFLRPAYFIMLIPIYAQKLLAADFGFWGISGQYSIEYTPIITLAFIDLIKIMRNWKFRSAFIYLTVILVIGTNLITLRTRKTPWYDRTTSDFMSEIHYSSDGLNVSYLHKELAKIPNGIPLSVMSCLAPHLANRYKIYHFPVIKDAEMIVVLKDKRSFYPMNKEDFDKKIKELVDSNEFKIVKDENLLLILKKIKHSVK
jgi:uncharacterized membrane protein